MGIYNYLALAIPVIMMIALVVILHYVDPVLPPKRPRR
jgi:hypothetical protein